MKKLFGLLTSAVLCASVSASTAVFADSEQEKKGTSNRYNVVYVLDNSGSMKNTDPENMRYEAVSLFNNLLANDGNRVGSVVFSDDIKLKHDVEEIKSPESKKILMDEIKKTEISGWTNIGEALETAEEMLKTNGDPNLESVILFLTDGNTEMGTKEATEKSLDQKASAIQTARDEEIRIFSICLNSEGSKANAVNPDEMKQIANATGGDYVEVKSDDLDDAFKKFYEMIFSTKANIALSEKMNAQGEVSKEFYIPSAGIEEINLIINADEKLDDITLTKPDGTKIKGQSQQSTDSGKYSVVKLQAPAGGNWIFNAKGKPGSSVETSILFNTSLTVSSEIENPKESYELGENFRLVTKIMTNGVASADEAVTEDYQVSAVIANSSGSEKTVPVEYKDGVFFNDFTAEDYGTYSVYVTVEGNGISAKSEASEVYVGNTPPQALVESVSKITNIWPFADLDCDVNLTEAFSDKEDSELTYSVDSSSFLESSYAIENGVLKMKKFDISKGSFTIRATDSMGASATMEVYLDSRNIPLYIAIGLLILILIIILIPTIKVYLEWARKFKGTISVKVMLADGKSESTSIKPPRGRYRLSSMGLPEIDGFDYNGMYFVSKGRDHVELRSKTGFYCIGSGGIEMNKLNIDHAEREIFIREDNGEAIILRYKADE